MRIEIDFVSGDYSLFLGQDLIQAGTVGIYECGKPHIKFGIYRPGMWPWKKELDPNNDHISVIDYDALKIKEYE
jgi:hypothetical protein